MIWLGNDIVRVERIQKLIVSFGDKAIRHIFTEDEKNYCSSKASPFVHYAGRFAGKEAVKKALLSFNNELLIPLNKINICPVENGPPQVLLGNLIEGDFRISLSISHTDEYATAVAVLEAG